uniref:Ubiquitin carboxyl-terminal hydrolase n=1 Tax=Lepisosteus oculatus TaxID=7918 RepID=W5MM90_LEPOC
MSDLGEVLMSVLSTIRVPRPGDSVHKEECAFSFASPDSEGGLYVCMNTFLGFGAQFVERHYRRTGQRAFLHIKRTRRPQKEEENGSGAGDPPKKKPTRLAIGIEGGFDVSEQDQYDQEVKVVIFPERLEVTSEDLANMPDVVRERVSLSMAGVLSADSASHNLQVQQWDGEVRQVSKHAADLKQLDNGVKIPPWVSGWRCENCDLRENLWLNLTDGKVFCGRRYFDGSGGNNHALLHYQQTNYPLAVKLGTITPDGADVYSYEEDEMVLDPKLPEHLAHWGIDMMTMEKVCPHCLYSTSVLSLSCVHSACTRHQSCPCPVSALPVLYSDQSCPCPVRDPRFRLRIPTPVDPSLCPTVLTGWTKLGYGLLSGEYSKPAPDPGEDPSVTPEPKGDQVGIAPRMFKALIGRGHPEFSTNRQQDAQEFLLHFINMVERNCRSSDNPTEAYRFLMEERIVCQQSQRVKYTQRVDYILQLPVPMEHATNTEELQEYERRRREAEETLSPPPPAVRAVVPFSVCLAAFSEPETLEEFWSSALQAKSTASKTTRFASFPDHLVIQIKKFTFGLDWVPKKLDVSIDVPDSLDLSALRGAGLQPGEEELPDLAPPPLVTPDVEVKGIPGGFHGNEEDDSLCSPLLFSASAPVLDESTVGQLIEMGFPIEACRKAVYYTGNTGIDSAMNWVMTHMDDPDFSAPLVLPGSSSAPGGTPTSQTTPTESVSEEHLATIISMGFSRDQASRALRATSNVLERAVDWIFSHLDDLDSMDVSEGRSAADSVSEREPPQGPRVRDGPGKYELFAFISHMGSSTMCGHYVCHIKKNDQWVIFNDQKVCASEKPPKDLGYLYFYRRVTE